MLINQNSLYKVKEEERWSSLHFYPPWHPVSHPVQVSWNLDRRCSLFSASHTAAERKLKLKLDFYFRNGSFVYLKTKNRPVDATFTSMLVIFMHASSQCPHALDAVYHGALTFITNYKSITHPCLLYAWVGGPLLSVRRLINWYSFIFMVVLGLYLCSSVIWKGVSSHSLPSRDLLSLPHVRTERKKWQLAHILLPTSRKRT